MTSASERGSRGFLPVSAREVGNAVIAEIHGAGRGVGSGVEVQMTIGQVVRFRDGKCTWMQGYPTEEEALEAVGLSE